VEHLHQFWFVFLRVRSQNEQDGRTDGRTDGQDP